MNRKFISLFLYKKGRNLSLIVCAPARDGEDLDSQGEGSSQPDTISLASRTSQNTLDSDKVRTHTHRAQKWCPDLLQLWALKTNVIWSKGLSDGLVFHSSPAAVSWLWSYTTLWPATATSWRCGGVRLWRSWSAVTTNQTGAWSGPQTALLPRRAWCPALCSASPIPGPPWRWKASSITKVQKCNLICFTGKKSLIWWSVENPSLHPCCHGNTHISEGTVNAE